MAKQATTPLVEASVAFDAELTEYMKLGELLLKTPLTSVKQLERANTTLSELTASEGRLQQLGDQLIAAFKTVRDQQDAIAKGVIAHVPTMHARNQRLHELMTELSGVAAEVSGLNNAVQAKPDGSSSPATGVDPGEVSEVVLGVSARAARLATAAQEAQFEELATQAHALHQRLQAIGKKLRKASGADERS